MSDTTTPAWSEEQIQALDNERLLRLLQVVCDDVWRRVENYSAATTTYAVLDGMKFNAKASAITKELQHGSTHLGSPRVLCGLSWMEREFPRLLAKTTLDEEIAGGQR